MEAPRPCAPAVCCSPAPHTPPLACPRCPTSGRMYDTTYPRQKTTAPVPHFGGTVRFIRTHSRTPVATDANVLLAQDFYLQICTHEVHGTRFETPITAQGHVRKHGDRTIGHFRVIDRPNIRRKPLASVSQLPDASPSPYQTERNKIGAPRRTPRADELTTDEIRRMARASSSPCRWSQSRR